MRHRRFDPSKHLLSVLLDYELHDSLRALAQQRERSISAEARIALRRHIRRQHQRLATQETSS